MIALAYLLAVAISLVVLAVALRRRPTPTPPLPPAFSADGHFPTGVDADVRLILVAATQLAARLTPAA